MACPIKYGAANLVHSESALPEADAAAFEKRMFDWLLERADLPYLDAADQRCVIHSLLVLLMRSMRKRKSASSRGWFVLPLPGRRLRPSRATTLSALSLIHI